MLQPCRLTVGELRKLVTKARKQNHLTGPASKEQLLALFEAHADMDESVAQVLEGPMRVPMLAAALPKRWGGAPARRKGMLAQRGQLQALLRRQRGKLVHVGRDRALDARGVPPRRPCPLALFSCI